MSVDELIQLMRTCSLAKVRAELQRMKDKYPATYDEVERFYQAASKQKEK